MRCILLVAIVSQLFSCSSPTQTNTPIPTSHTGGTVSGVFMPEPPDNPLVGMPVYLGEVLLANGTPVFSSLNKQAAPKAIVESNGKFVFVNVPPGTYSLIADMVSHTIILRDPTTGGDILVDVKTGENVDLGTLTFPILSLTPQP